MHSDLVYIIGLYDIGHVLHDFSSITFSNGNITYT